MAEQREPWKIRAAHWKASAPEGASLNDGPNRILIDLAGIKAGDHVLDLASGTGEPAISIALEVGEHGSVDALDASPEMLDGARARAQNLGLANISFHVGPMEEIPFDDGRFDAVTCRFGLMHADDAAAALRGVRRVLKPGGRAACMVHGARARNNQFDVVRATVLNFLGETEQQETLQRFRFSAQGELTGLFKDAGFSHVTEREIANWVVKKSGEKFWAAMVKRSFAARLADKDAADLAALDAQIEAAFEPFLKDGEYRLLSTERVVSGVA